MNSLHFWKPSSGGTWKVKRMLVLQKFLKRVNMNIMFQLIQNIVRILEGNMAPITFGFTSKIMRASVRSAFASVKRLKNAKKDTAATLLVGDTNSHQN